MTFNFKQINRPKEYMDWNEISRYSKYIAEPKFDGVRMLATKKDGVLTLHREDKNIKNKQFPEILKQLVNMPDNTTIDGEVCILKGTDKEQSLKSNFDLIQGRASLTDDMRIKILGERNPATFVAFDCPVYSGVDVRMKPLSERRTYLDGLLKVDQYEDPEELLGMIKKNNMEGIVVKDPNGTYKSEWFKFKYFMETNFKIAKVLSQKRNISSLELEDLETGEIVGTTKWLFDEHQSEELKKSLIGKIAVVRHMTTEKIRLRFPSLQNKNDLLRVEA
jgi:ATP-dependent DNA ligase